MSSHSGTSLIFYFLINIFNFSIYKPICFLDKIDPLHFFLNPDTDLRWSNIPVGLYSGILVELFDSFSK